MRLCLNILILLITCCATLTPGVVHAQDITDTLFYDARWQLCERTPATYYRIGTMRIDSLARYIGPATDYFMNGQPEMKVTYSQLGDLNGDAVFYYANGNIRMKGQFTVGKMTGEWSFYNEDGTLRAAMLCKDDKDFTPIYLTNKKGKVILKDGNSKFRLETKDFTDFMAPAGYEISGEVSRGQKDGIWEYSTETFSLFNRGRSRKTIISEQYVRGRFIRALTDPDNPASERRILNRPFSKITLYPPKLLTLDMLRSDIIFAPDKDGRYQLRAFLVARRPPVIEETPRSPDMNFSLFIRVIGNALLKRPELATRAKFNPGKIFPGYSFEMIRMITSSDKSLRYDANIRFTITPDGRVGDLGINGKIDDRSKELISYYLSKIRNLFVSPNPADNNITLALQTRSTLSSGNIDVIMLSRPSADWN